jgi:hypothetical protein
MTIDRIPRYNASVDGETVFLRDMPTGTLVNTTLLISAVQRRIAVLKEQVNCQSKCQDVIIRMQMKGRIWELEDILRALGEEPL